MTRGGFIENNIMSREDFIRNSSIIQKALKNCTKDDITYLTNISAGIGIDQKDVRLKQLLYHMCSGLNIFELARLKKAFSILMRL